MFLRVLVILVVLGGAAGGVAYLKWQQMQEMAGQQMQMPPTTISAAEVAKESWLPMVAAVGSLRAVQGIELSPEVAGIVTEILFESGDQVEEGDLLLKLDDDVDRAALAALRAEEQLARVEYNRAEELLPKRAVSQADYDQAKAALQAARARVAEQQAVIDQKEVRAPFSGVLGIRQVDSGQYIMPGEAIVSLTALDPIYVDFTLPERRLTEVEEGMRIEVRADAYPATLFVGEVSTIGTGIDSGTRSVELRGTLPNDDRRLRPGMFAEVQLVKAVAEEVLTAPRTAISFNTYGDFVYRLVEEEGQLTARRQQVETGAVRDGRVVIRSGLDAGERIVGAGLVKLRDGAAVQVDDSVVLDEGGAVSE